MPRTELEEPRVSDTLVTGTPEEAGFYPDRIELTARRAHQWIDEGVTTSLVLLAARNGTIGLERAFGVSGYGSDEPLSESLRTSAHTFETTTTHKET